MENLCKNCKVCNGKACASTLPGPGAKGSGDNAIRNYEMWRKVRVNMDTLVENLPVSTEANLFGRTFAGPIFAGPVGAVKMHYDDRYDDLEYNKILIKACKDAGLAAFTGDGIFEEVMISACQVIKENDGYGVPTVKPWSKEMVEAKMKLVRDSGAFAVAMDVDAAGLPFVKSSNIPAGRKTKEELKEIIDLAGVPFIVKGIMTVKGAKKAIEAGADAIIVSNHGGRVLDQCPSTCEVLEEIVEAVGNDTMVLVDGGIRSGVDVFKALAMGAKGVLMARPFTNALYSGQAQGVIDFSKKILAELEDTMFMCGAYKLEDITRDMIRVTF